MASCHHGEAAATPPKQYAPCSSSPLLTDLWTEVVASTDSDNLASQRVLEKAGFNRVASPEGVAYLVRPQDA